MRNAGRVSGLAGGQGPRGWHGRDASPIQMHQERKLHRADPSAHHFCSKPMSCIIPSHTLFAPVSSCSRLSRNGVMLRPVQGLLEVCSSWACWKRAQLLIHIVLAFLFLLSSPGLTPIFLRLFCLFFFFSLSAFLCGWSWQE